MPDKERQGMSLSERFGWPIVIIAASAIAIRSLGGHDTPHQQTDVLFRFMTLLMLLFLMVGKILEPSRKFSKQGVYLPLFFFLAFATFSAFTAQNHFIAREKTIEWITTAIFFFVLVESLTNISAYKIILLSFLASGFAGALYGIYDACIFKPSLLEMAKNDPEQVMAYFGDAQTTGQALARIQSMDVSGVFSISNSLAGFVAIVAIVQAGVLWTAIKHAYASAIATETGFFKRFAVGRAWSPWLFVSVSAVALAVEMWVLILTRSRGGLIAFAAGIMIFVATTTGIWKKRKIVFGTVALVLVLISTAVFFTQALESKSLKIRLEYWKGTWGIIKDNSVTGVGPENFPDHYETYKTEPGTWARRAHNNYLQLWAETGILGLAAFIWFWLAFFRTGSRQNLIDKKSHQTVFAKTSISGKKILVSIFIICVVAFMAMFFLEQKYLYERGDSYQTGLLVFLLTGLLWLAYICAGCLSFPSPEKEKPGDADWTPIFCSLPGAVVSFLVHSLVDFTLYVPAVFGAVFVCAALAIAYRDKYSADIPPAPGTTPARHSSGQALAIVATAIAGIFIWWFFILAPWHCNTRYKLAGELMDSARQKANTPGFAQNPIGRTNAFGDFLKAERAYEKALEYEKSDPEIYHGIAQTAFWQYWLEPKISADRYEKAKKFYLLAISKSPRNSVLQNLYAKILSMSEDKKTLFEAVAHYEKALEIYPLNPPVMMELAEVEYRLGNDYIDKALRNVYNALEINNRIVASKLTDETQYLDIPGVISAHETLLKIAMASRNERELARAIEKAKEHFIARECSKRKPPRLAFMIGEALMVAGEEKKAIKYYKEAVLFQKLKTTTGKLNPDQLRRAMRMAGSPPK